MVRGGSMKETKSIKVLLIAIVIFGVLYNAFLGMILAKFNVYDFQNIFFIIKYTHHNDPDNMKYIPQFLNWLLVVLFVFFNVLWILRHMINKDMKIKHDMKK